MTWLGWLLAIILAGVLYHNDRRRWRECMRQKNRAKHYQDMAEMFGEDSDRYKRQAAWLAGECAGNAIRMGLAPGNTIEQETEEWLKESAAAATKEDE